MGPGSGTDAVRGLAACFVAGTVSSFLAALITLRIKDSEAGLRCGRLVCVKAKRYVENPDTSPNVPAGVQADPKEPPAQPHDESQTDDVGQQRGEVV